MSRCARVGCILVQAWLCIVPLAVILCLPLPLSFCRSTLLTVLTLIRSWPPSPPPYPTWWPLTETWVWKDSNSPSTLVRMMMPPSLEWQWSEYLHEWTKKSHLPVYVNSSCTPLYTLHKAIPLDTLIHSNWSRLRFFFLSGFSSFEEIENCVKNPARINTIQIQQ